LSELVDATEEPTVSIQPVVLPKKPRVWTVFVALLAAIVAAGIFQAVAVVALVSIEIAQGATAKAATEELPAKLTTPAMFMLLAACGQLAFALAVAVPAWLSPTPVRERLGVLPAGPSWTVYPLAALATWFVLAIGIALAYALALILPADLSVQKLFDNMTLVDAVPFVLFIALVPGVVEELLFRGYIQRRLIQRWSPVTAIGVTSVLFALVHVMPHAIVAVLPLGLWFGYVAWKSNSVLPTMVAHAFVNGSLNAWRMIAKFGEISEPIQLVVVILAVLVGLVCFVLLLRSFSRREHEVAVLLDV